MPIVDMTFNNPKIKAFFLAKEGVENAPVDELMYLHSRPLVKPTFMGQLEDAISELEAKAVAGKVPNEVIEKLILHAVEIGKPLPELTREAAISILVSLREVYRICKAFTDKP